MRARDSQRQRLYDAERTAVMPGHKPYDSIQDVRKRVEQIVTSKWFTKRAVILEWHVYDGRGHKSATGAMTISCGCPVGRLVFPRWARSEMIILHEIAHVLTEYQCYEHRGQKYPAWHGPEYAKNYLALVQRFMGRKAAKELRVEFKKHKVKYTTPKTAKQHPIFM